jgi:5S rRNA maturation endonuclease (ribonuclease M5)
MVAMKNINTEKVLEFFRKLEDCLLIVEGKRDVRALNTLGLTNILAINGRPLIAIVEMVAELMDSQASKSLERKEPRVIASDEVTGFESISDIIILTDFDKEGRRIAGRLLRLLRAHKISPNQRLRLRIMNLGFNKIEDITMDSILASNKSVCGGRRLPVEKSVCGRRSLPIKRLRKEGDDYVKTSSNVHKIRGKGVNKGKGSGRKAGHHRSGVWSD